MKWCFTKDKREALIKDHLKPDSPSCKAPAVDKFMKEFQDKRFPKEEDGELAKIQAATLLQICPLAFAWNSLLERHTRPRHTSPSNRRDINDTTYHMPHS